MISRRSFLKVSGLTAVALSTGYGAGKLNINNKNSFFAVHGFIPAEEKIFRQIVSSFTEKVKPSSDAIIFADTRHTSIINEIFNQRTGRSENGNVKITLTKINADVQSDIIVSENNSAVLNPESFNSAFTGIRSEIKSQRAEYFIKAEFREQSLLSSLLYTNTRTAIIENEKGIVDKLNLNRSYNDIIVNGPYGRTTIALKNGSIGIHSSSCRNQICKHSGYINENGQIVACAPNKIILRIESV